MAITKIPAAGFTGNNFKNIIINGDMSIAQRGTSATGITGSGFNTVDRFSTNILNMGTFTETQSTDVPSGQGFATSLKLDCTTADASPAAGDNIQWRQKVEGKNLQYLKFGTANAESLTLSFWVKSSKTGTYIVQLRHHDASPTILISKSYTISSANTWEKKTLTFPRYTTTAFDNDNNASLFINWWLGAGTNFTSGTLNTSWSTNVDADSAVGQVNLADSTANEWYITGVQLEAGTTASDFEFLPYDVNLRRCYRYYYVHATGSEEDIGIGGYYNGSHLFVNISFLVPMRSAPSADETIGTNYYSLVRNGGSDNFNEFKGGGSASKHEINIYNNTEASGTAGQVGYARTINASASLAFDSEL